MAIHTFDVDAFRKMFPAFADTTKYPDELLSGYFAIASCNINLCDSPVIHGKCLDVAINLMTAHVAYLMGLAATGRGQVGIQVSAGVDKVSISVQAPPVKSAWQQWLSLSPYGLQFWAMMQMKAAGGFYIGGLPETMAFKKVGGLW